MKEHNQNRHFRKFLNEHIRIIKKLCRAYSNSEEDYEDLVQEVCFQIWKSLKNFKGKSKSSTWVYRVTLNVCLTMIKKSKTNMLIPTDTKTIVNKVEKESRDNDQDEKIELLYASIASLDPLNRAIIMLYLDKKSHTEISDILGLSMSNIGIRIHRIKIQLKKIVHERITRDLG